MCQKRKIILSLFCTNLKGRYHLTEISKLSKLPLKTTFRVLKELEEENLLHSKIEGRQKYFTLNLDNVKTKFLLLETEIYRTLIFLEKYPVFKSFLKEILIEDCTILVFGSFAEFTATNKSDLDLLIISERKLDLPFHLLPFKIHLISLTKNEFLKGLELKEPLLLEILSNHIVLYNHSFFLDVLWWYYGKKA